MTVRHVNAFDVDHTENQIECEFEEVSICPICHYGIRPQIVAVNFVEDGGTFDHNYSLYITNFCPKCRSMFLSEYGPGYQNTFNPRFIFDEALSSVPLTPEEANFSQEIKELSPTFVETYNQAQYAESLELTQICGVGYRKALEYLTKDYLCHKFSDQEEAIKAEQLGNSLKRIDDSRIRTLAERSVWIGNDETHYVRKHEDLDFNDMKRFITALLRYIDSELAFEDAESIERK